MPMKKIAKCGAPRERAIPTNDAQNNEIVAVQADEAVLTDRGHIDYEKAQSLSFAGGYYWRMGELLGRFGDWRQGAGVEKE